MRKSKKITGKHKNKNQKESRENKIFTHPFNLHNPFNPFNRFNLHNLFK